MELGVIEVVVNRRKNPLVSVLRVLCIIGAVTFLFFGLTLMSVIGLGALIPIAIGAGCIVGAWAARMNSQVDYEYSLVDRELRVAKIMNKERRKSVGQYDLNKMEILAVTSSSQLDSYHNMNDVKTLDYSSADPAQNDSLFELYLIDQNTKERLLLNLADEDGQKLLNAVRMFAPRKVVTS